MTILEKSLEIANIAHLGQFRRDNKTPYITHPIAVKEFAEKWAQDYFKWLTGTNQYPSSSFDFFTISRSYEISKEELIEIIGSVSLLHDSVEDNLNITFSFLWNELSNVTSDRIARIIVGAVLALTHNEEKSYLDYILDVKLNSIAKVVKVADITHNISTRNGSNTAGEIKKDKLAIEKYELAKYILLH